MAVNFLDILLVVALVLAALFTVVSVRLLRSVIGLAVTSVLLTVMMFRLDSALAAVFELSVCAGLIPAIFISTIGLTPRTNQEDMPALRREKIKRYALLPILMIVAGVALTRVVMPDLTAPPQSGATDVRKVLWNERQIDLIGQVVVLLAGALGVVVLVKERKEPKHES
jgi:NADH-quinone oxidoreductase subunit J